MYIEFVEAMATTSRVDEADAYKIQPFMVGECLQWNIGVRLTYLYGPDRTPISYDFQRDYKDRRYEERNGRRIYLPVQKVSCIGYRSELDDVHKLLGKSITAAAFDVSYVYDAHSILAIPYRHQYPRPDDKPYAPHSPFNKTVYTIKKKYEDLYLDTARQRPAPPPVVATDEERELVPFEYVAPTDMRKWGDMSSGEENE